MTEKELTAITDKIMPSIKKLAYIFVKKFKQPSSYSVDDLISEAMYTIVGQMKSGRPDPSKGAAITTYLIRAIRGRFIHLVNKSYKLDFDPNVAKRRKLNRLHRDLKSITKHPESDGSNVLLTLMKELSDREQEYVSMLIFPPQHIMTEVQKDTKKVRGQVRQNLNMDREEERSIRRKIKDLLLETV
jgi:DNA-directed RNA polymerase specialized sigma subunit